MSGAAWRAWFSASPRIQPADARRPSFIGSARFKPNGSPIIGQVKV
jgi:hypothetical protein